MSTNSTAALPLTARLKSLILHWLMIRRMILTRRAAPTSC